MVTRKRYPLRLGFSALSLFVIAACSGGCAGPDSIVDAARSDLSSLFGLLDTNRKPVYKGDILVSEYDGVRDDFVTGGLGRIGLEQPVPPTPADPLNSTAAELRRLVVYNNSRALNDLSASGGVRPPVRTEC